MMDELLEQFLVEGRELVQQASDDLLALERDPVDPARVDSAFRAVHTLKGSAGLFDLAPMGWALHAAEDLLVAARDARAPPSREAIGALLGCVALVEEWVEAVARAGHLPAGAHAQGRDMEQALRAVGGMAAPADGAPVIDARPTGGASAELATGEAAAAWLAAALARQGACVAAAQEAGHAVVAVRYVPSADCFFLGDDPVALLRQVPDLIGLRIMPLRPWSPQNFDPFACNLVIEALSTAPLGTVRAVFRTVADQVLVAAAETVAPPARSAGAQISAAADARPLRVDAARVDALMDVVGELLVATNGYAHLARQAVPIDPRLAQALGANMAEIDRLVGDLHGAVMRVRMTPLARSFRRLPRLVRDIAAQLGKVVAFDMTGEELEADRRIVDGLFEPLLHVLRNAIDHGIESAAARAAAGKAAPGRITLDARREADRLVIAVRDDGAGIDRARVRATALARGLLSAPALDALDDRAVLDLVFMPGFSTAAAVTHISGRGVGMDAVRTTIEALGGQAWVTSEPGAGAAVTLSLPQSMLITTVMTVRVGEERFGIPIETVAETARVPSGRIVPLRDGEAFILRNRTVPLLRLAVLLEGADAPRSGRPGGWPPGQRAARPAGDAKVLIARWGDHHVGVEVDGFGERTDVLVRPLTGLLAGMSGLLGAALLGDGSVMMVLDLAELIR